MKQPNKTPFWTRLWCRLDGHQPVWDGRGDHCARPGCMWRRDDWPFLPGKGVRP